MARAFRRFFVPGKPIWSGTKPRRGVRLLLERLEDRWAPAVTKYLLLGSDNQFHIDGMAHTINASGMAGDAEVETFNFTNAVPTLAFLQQYTGVLAYTTLVSPNGTVVGNRLADYVDGGGRVVLATYAFSESWAIGGRIMNAPYSPFAATPDGHDFEFGESSDHTLSGFDPEHPVFAGVTESDVYWVATDYTNPPLNAGATLLASDFYGNRVVAVNQAESVYGISIAAAALGIFTTDEGIYRLFVNAMVAEPGGGTKVTAVSPSLTSGPLAPGLTSLKITFNKSVLGANNAQSYSLQGAGADTELGTDDDIFFTVTPTYNDSTHVTTLKFAPLPLDSYRLTVKDAVTDRQGHPLSGGNFVRDFDANAPVNFFQLNLNSTVRGKLTDRLATDRWSFTVPAGQQVRFNLVARENADVLFDLIDPNGDPLLADQDQTSDVVTLDFAGTYTVVVHARNSVDGGAYSFNLEQTLQTPLDLDVPFDGMLLASGEVQLFKVTITDGNPLRVTLTDTNQSNINEIYVRRGSPPTRGVYDFRATSNAANQMILAPFASPGEWYVLVFARKVTAPSSFSLLAESNPVFVTGVSPGSFPSNQVAAVTLSGAGFVPGSQVELTRSGGPTVNGQSERVDSFSSMSATFDLNGVPAGSYDVRVTLPGGGTTTLANGFTVLASGQAQLETKLELPEFLGRHAAATFYVEYANVGNVPMPAPILILHNTNGLRPLLTLEPRGLVQGLWTDALPQGFSNEIQIYASGATPGMLLPGERVRVPVYYAGLQLPWDFDNDNTQSYEILIEEAGNTEAVDWAGMKDDLRPSWMPAAAWDGIYANLVGQIGPTWGDYVRMLSNNATYLGRLGIRVVDAGELFAFAASQAAGGISPVSSIAAATDGFAVTPGLPLTFMRAFGPGILPRHRVGAFGRGWSTPWQITLEEQADGTIAISDSAGQSRDFKPDIRGVGRYLARAGDTGVLRKVSGAWELTETSGAVTRFRADHSLEYIQDINGNRITATFTAGRLTKLAHSNGAWIDVAYNGDGLISSLTSHAGTNDVVGLQVTYTYDSVNKLLLTATGPGGTTTYGYDLGTNAARKYALTSITDGAGVMRTFEYDAFGRIADSFLPGNVERVDYTYDLGAVTRTDEAGVDATIFFEHRGLIARQEDGLGNYLRYTYDDLKHLTRVVDALGHEIDYTRCNCGRPITISDQYGNLTRFTLGGPHNDATALRDANGNLTRFGYDVRGNLTTTTYADDSVETIVYDAQGLPQQVVNRRGQTVTLTRDSGGRVTRADFPDLTFTTYTYDARGRLETATDSHGTITFTYDTADRTTRVDYPGGRFVQYTYDGAGRRATMEDDSGLKVRYIYDAAGRLSELKDATNVIETRIVLYTYDNAGRLAREDNGNGSYTTYGYDGAGRVASVTNFAPTDSANSQFAYTYDALGRRTSAVTSDGTWTYTYDLTGQLTHAVLDSTNGLIPDQDLVYEYDAVGNRVRTLLNGVETLYVANGLNEYDTVDGVTFSYDADGNLTDDGTRTYSYDALDRLTQVVSGVDTWQYEYDALGHRVATVFNGARTEYLIDPSGLGNVIGAYDDADVRTASYVHGFGLAAAEIGGNWDYYDLDGTGSVVGLTDNTGAYVNVYSYDPFGRSLFATEGVANPFQFVGGLGVIHEGNGLDFMRARYYDAILGRFTSPDPMGLGGGDVNLYRYAANDPVNLVDPSGMKWCWFDANNIGWGDAVGANRDVSQQVRDGTWDWKGHSDVQNAAARHDLALGNYHNETGGGWSDNHPTVQQAHNDLATSWFNTGIVNGVLPDIIWNIGNLNLGFWCPDDPKPTPKPKPKGKKGPGGDSGTASSVDPNEIIAPTGFGERNFVAADRNLNYRINYENDAQATAPAQRVLITSQLAAEFDWSTFAFTAFGFGDENVTAPEGSQHFETTLPMTFNNKFFNVEIAADFDATTGLINVTFDSIVPLTQLPPDVLTGFLPPEDGSGRGMGYFTYVIRAGATVPSGTEIRSVALIQFDRNPFIATNQVDEHDPTKGINPAKEAPITTDVDTPTTVFSVLPAVQSSLTFPIGWVGRDEAGGSGVGGYDVFVSDNNGPFTFLYHTNQTAGTFTGQDRHTYRFYALATDNVGHTEPDGSPNIRQTEVVLPPTAFSDTYAVDPRRRLTVAANMGVLKNDRNTSPRGTLSAVLVNNVTKGTLALRPDGSFTYTPGQTFDGLDQFSYKVRDNAGHEGNTVVVNLTSQVVSFRVDSASFGEAGGAGTIWVDLRQAPTSTLTVDFALGIGTAALGEDFDLTAGTLMFLAGQRSKPIPFTISNDVLDEFDETFRVVLSNPSAGALGRSETAVTIRDNDAPPVVGFTQLTSRVAEGAGAANIEVRLSAPSGKPVTVQVRPATGRGVGLGAAGTDFTVPPVLVTFAPGETFKAVSIPLFADVIDEPDEVVRLTLSGVTNASLGRSSHALTIVDDDPPPTVNFAATSSNANEGIGFVELTVSLSAASAFPVSMDVRITGGTGGAADYSKLWPARLTFAAGETTKTIRLFITDDASTEGDETLVISLQNASNAILGPFVGHTLTILDND